MSQCQIIVRIIKDVLDMENWQPDLRPTDVCRGRFVKDLLGNKISIWIRRSPNEFIFKVCISASSWLFEVTLPSSAMLVARASQPETFVSYLRSFPFLESDTHFAILHDKDEVINIERDLCILSMAVE